MFVRSTLPIVLLLLSTFCIAQGQWIEITKLQKQGKYPDTLNILNTLCVQDGKAMYLLADYFYNGRKDIPIDKNKGISFYQKAYSELISLAENGDAEAQYMVGICLQKGFYKNQEAVGWFLKATQQGNLKAQCALALALMTGKGITRNPEEALRLVQQATKMGSAEAKAYLASYYLSKKQNISEGIKLASESSNAQEPAGEYTLGMAYEKGIGVEKNTEKAKSLYRLAADQGSYDASLRLKWADEKSEPQK